MISDTKKQRKSLKSLKNLKVIDARHLDDEV
jgi:hypothetical protein